MAFSVNVPVKAGVAVLDSPSLIKPKGPINSIAKWLTEKLIRNTLSSEHREVITKQDNSEVIYMKLAFSDNTWNPLKWIGAKLVNSLLNYFIPDGLELPSLALASMRCLMANKG